MKRADVLGCQLDMTRCVAMRGLNRAIFGNVLRPVDVAAPVKPFGIARHGQARAGWSG